MLWPDDGSCDPAFVSLVRWIFASIVQPVARSMVYTPVIFVLVGFSGALSVAVERTCTVVASDERSQYRQSGELPLHESLTRTG